MKIIGQPQVKKAENLFKKIFKSADPFDEPFNPIFEEKCVLQIDDYQILNKYHSAISKALKAFGEKYVLHCPTEGLKNGKVSFEQMKFWKVNFLSGFYEELQEDKDWFAPVESAYFSESCLWAGIISHEWHIAIAGSKKFISELGKHLDLDEELNKFLRTWKYNQMHFKADLGWLPKFLSHIYGLEKAKKILLESSLLP